MPFRLISGLENTVYYIGPVASFRHAVIVERLPKTRSGKIVRATLRQIADGQPWESPATIDDPAILTDIEDRLAAIGYPRSTGLSEPS